jgi:hypothetical protein
MKKSLLFGAVIMLSVYGVVLPQELTKEEKKLIRQAEVLRAERGSYRRNLAKGTAIGAATGAAMLGATAVIDPDYIESGFSEMAAQAGRSKQVQSLAAVPKGLAVGAYAGAGLGAIWSIPYTATMHWWQRRKVSRIVNEHTGLDFKTIPMRQALVFVAAYKRNVPLLQKLITEQSGFVLQPGVWKALTELFFNDYPVSSRVRKLQKMIQED